MNSHGRLVDGLSLDQELERAEKGFGTSYLTHGRAVAFMDFCSAKGLTLTWLEAFEVRAEYLQMTEFSVLDLFGRVEARELDQIVRKSVQAAIDTGLEFYFVFWV